MWQNSGHGRGSHGGNHRSPGAKSPGHHPPAVCADCPVGNAGGGVDGAGRTAKTTVKGEGAAKLFAAAEQPTSARRAAAAEAELREETRRSSGPPETRAAAESYRAMRRAAPAQADPVPALWGEALEQRPGATWAPGVGTAREESARHRVPAASAVLSLLWGNDLFGAATGRG